MKFGKSIRREARNNGGLYLINFKFLKKIIKKIEVNPIINIKNEENFQEKLKEELSRVDLTYQNCLSEINLLLQNIQESFSNLLIEPNPSKYGNMNFEGLLNFIKSEHISDDLENFCSNLSYVSLRCKNLRCYVIWNSIAIVKILKKWRKHAVSKGYTYIKTAKLLSAQIWYSSPELPTILSRVDTLQDSLMLRLTSFPPSPERYTCPICLDIIVDPVSLRGCCHRFCWNCLAQTSCNALNVSTELETCPYCRTAFPLDPESFEVDGVLNQFLNKYFGENTKHRQAEVESSRNIWLDTYKTGSAKIKQRSEQFANAKDFNNHCNIYKRKENDLSSRFTMNEYKNNSDRCLKDYGDEILNFDVDNCNIMHGKVELKENLNECNIGNDDHKDEGFVVVKNCINNYDCSLNFNDYNYNSCIILSCNECENKGKECTFTCERNTSVGFDKHYEDKNDEGNMYFLDDINCVYNLNEKNFDLNNEINILDMNSNIESIIDDINNNNVSFNDLNNNNVSFNDLNNNNVSFNDLNNNKRHEEFKNKSKDDYDIIARDLLNENFSLLNYNNNKCNNKLNDECNNALIDLLIKGKEESPIFPYLNFLLHSLCSRLFADMKEGKFDLICQDCKSEDKKKFVDNQKAEEKEVQSDFEVNIEEGEKELRECNKFVENNFLLSFFLKEETMNKHNLGVDYSEHPVFSFFETNNAIDNANNNICLEKDLLSILISSSEPQNMLVRKKVIDEDIKDDDALKLFMRSTNYLEEIKNRSLLKYFNLDEINEKKYPKSIYSVPIDTIFNENTKDNNNNNNHDHSNVVHKSDCNNCSNIGEILQEEIKQQEKQVEPKLKKEVEKQLKDKQEEKKKKKKVNYSFNNNKCSYKKNNLSDSSNEKSLNNNNGKSNKVDESEHIINNNISSKSINCIKMNELSQNNDLKRCKEITFEEFGKKERATNKIKIKKNINVKSSSDSCHYASFCGNFSEIPPPPPPTVIFSAYANKNDEIMRVKNENKKESRKSRNNCENKNKSYHNLLYTDFKRKECMVLEKGEEHSKAHEKDENNANVCVSSSSYFFFSLHQSSLSTSSSLSAPVIPLLDDLPQRKIKGLLPTPSNPPDSLSLAATRALRSAAIRAKNKSLLSVSKQFFMNHGNANHGSNNKNVRMENSCDNKKNNNTKSNNNTKNNKNHKKNNNNNKKNSNNISNDNISINNKQINHNFNMMENSTGDLIIAQCNSLSKNLIYSEKNNSTLSLEGSYNSVSVNNDDSLYRNNNDKESYNNYSVNKVITNNNDFCSNNKNEAAAISSFSVISHYSVPSLISTTNLTLDCCDVVNSSSSKDYNISVLTLSSYNNNSTSCKAKKYTHYTNHSSNYECASSKPSENCIQFFDSVTTDQGECLQSIINFSSSSSSSCSSSSCSSSSYCSSCCCCSSSSSSYCSYCSSCSSSSCSSSYCSSCSSSGCFSCCSSSGCFSCCSSSGSSCCSSFFSSSGCSFCSSSCSSFCSSSCSSFCSSSCSSFCSSSCPFSCFCYRSSLFSSLHTNNCANNDQNINYDKSAVNNGLWEEEKCLCKVNENYKEDSQEKLINLNHMLHQKQREIEILRKKIECMQNIVSNNFNHSSAHNF